MRWFLLLIISASAVWAQQLTSGDWTYTVNALNEATIIGYSGEGGDVSVPSAVGGYSVKQIGGGWPPVFAIENTNINRIIIPNGVSRIGDWAFAYNYGLSSVSLPESVQTIGDWVFYYCHSLAEVVIPQGVTSVGDRAFTACYSLSTLDLPETLRIVGVLAFADCFALTNISLPSSLETISAAAFANCTNLVALNLPENLQSIGDSAFAGSRLTSVSLPASLSNLGILAFGLGLTNVVVDPLNPNFAAQNNILFNKTFSKILITPKNLAGHFIVPSTVTNIGAYAFAERTNLTEITLPAGIKSIGDLAFFDCRALQSILFFGDAPSIGAQTFDYSSATVYWTMGHAGWGSDLGGRPTEMLSHVYTLTQFNANRTNGQTDVTTNPAAFDLFTQSQYDSNRKDGQTDVTTNPAAFNLFTQSQYNANYSSGVTAGISTVLSNPASYNLYDSNSIMDLRMGGLMIQKVGTSATVFFQPQTTINPTSVPFTDNGPPITKTFEMPGNKGFLRVQALAVAPDQMITVQGGTLPQSSQLAGTVVETFRIGKYEVTWGEWHRVKAWATSRGYDFDTWDVPDPDAYPVRRIGWNDAAKFCNAKSEMEQLQPVYQASGTTYKSGWADPTVNSAANGYRLPSEAEWEWAARGGLNSANYIYSGSDSIDAVAWYNANHAGLGPRPGGQKAPNELGIYDMSGNLYEFTQDPIYGGSFRRSRGGSWFANPEHSRVVDRFDFPDYGFGHIGFRLARKAP